MSFTNFSTSLKVSSLLAMLVVTSLCGTLFASYSMRHIDADYRGLLHSEVLAAQFGPRANRFLMGVSAALYRNATATTDVANAEAVAQRTEAEKGFFEYSGKAKAALPSFSERFSAQEDAFRRTMSGSCGEVIRLANDTSDPSGNAKAAALMNEVCDPALAGIRNSLFEINNDLRDLISKESDELTGQTNSTVLTMLIALIGGACAVLAIALYLTRTGIVRPLQSLMGTMGQIAEGRLDVQVDGAERKDEVGALARALEVLLVKLKEAEALRAQQAEAQAQREARQRVVEAAIRKFESEIGRVVTTVSSASGQLEQAATQLTKTASNTQQLSTAVAAASEQTSANVQGVAAASEQLAATVGEIGRQVQESSAIASRAVEQAANTNEQVAQLSNAANRIGDVVNLINSIAGQTNLLALNATIEAARAGDAGKGFAVVAQEVKALASQTGKATNEIASQISGMQAATDLAVQAIQEITTTINRMSEISGAIAAAVEEQDATTKEISRNVQEAAKGTSEVAGNVSDVSQGAAETGSASNQVLSSAKQLAGESTTLRSEVDTFLSTVRAA